MNPHKSFRSAMTWLHTWSGLLLGWVLFAIFVTGSAAYFRPEITAWMQPETARIAGAGDAARHAFARLGEVAPGSERWIVSLPEGRDRELSIRWKDPAQAGGAFRDEALDASAGLAGAAPRATHGGEFFYRFHFQLMFPYPWGRYLASLAALFLLVALVSGVVTHRRFFADLFLLRLRRDGRRPWLDFHNLAAVVALPFYLLIGYSALVIFTPMLLPLATRWLAPAKPAAVAAAPASTTETAAPPSWEPDAARWIAPDKFELMLAHVERAWGDERPARHIDVSGRGTAKAAVVFTRAEDRASVSYIYQQRETLRFSGLTGLPLDTPRPVATLGERIRGLFYGLHLARFAGPLLRALCFAMGLMGAAMIGTGLVLWTLKRKDRLAAAGRGGRFGFALVERLNIATIAGLPVACASLFWANRLIPAAQPGRADLEPVCFLVVWGVALLHACVRPARAAWKEQFAAAAFAFGALPALDLLTAGRQLGTWPRADALYVGFTFAFLVLGAGFAFGAVRLARRAAPAVAPASPKTTP